MRLHNQNIVIVLIIIANFDELKKRVADRKKYVFYTITLLLHLLLRSKLHLTLLWLDTVSRIHLVPTNKSLEPISYLRDA